MQELQKSIVSKPVRWPVILAFIACFSVLLNMMQYVDSFKEYGALSGRPRYHHEWIAADYENERLANENLRLTAENRTLEADNRYLKQELVAEWQAEARAAHVTSPISSFDAVDPASVYYGCLEQLSRMGTFYDKDSPYHWYVLRACDLAAEWTMRHPGEPNPLIRFYGR